VPQEYAQLKDKLLDNTRKSGSLIGLYFLLVVNGQVRTTGPHHASQARPARGAAGWAAGAEGQPAAAAGAAANGRQVIPHLLPLPPTSIPAQAAACCMLGTAFSYAYMVLLCRDIDAVQGDDKVPHWEADKVGELLAQRGQRAAVPSLGRRRRPEAAARPAHAPLPPLPAPLLQIENPILRPVAKLAAAYQQALKPRLLLLVAMAATLGLYNKLAEEPLSLVYQGCALGGFLSYKLALLLELFQQNTVKVRRGAQAGTATWSSWLADTRGSLLGYGRRGSAWMRLPAAAWPVRGPRE
jgi:hypothetical protein